MSKNVKNLLLTKSKNECKISKTEVKKIRKQTIQRWLPIEEIYENGIIKINKNKYIKILKIIPINYNLKSDLEKDTILNSYKILLKTCNFDIQILIQSKKEDLSGHIKNIKNNSEKENNKIIKKYSEKYIEFIKEKNKGYCSLFWVR